MSRWDELTPGSTWIHAKGYRYLLYGTVKHSETLEELVLYEALYDNPRGKLWVRPVEMFLGDMEWPKGTGIMKPRFVRE